MKFGDILSGVSTFGGLGSAIGSFIAGNANNKLQQLEAQRNREFQSLENQKSRDFSLKMWNMNNAYNDPSAVVARLSRAGLNKSLMYGGSNGITPASSVPIGSGASGAMPNTQNPLSPDIARTVAETRLINSQADKLDSETQGQMTYNKYSEQLYSGQVKMQNVQIDVGKSVKEMNEEQKHLTYKLAKRVDSEIDDLNASARWKNFQADIAESDSKFYEVRSQFSNQYWGTLIKDMENKARVSYQEAETFMLNFYSVLGLRSAQTNEASKSADYLERMGIKVGLENGRLSIQLALDSDYSEYERKLELILGAISGLYDAVNIYKTLRPSRSTRTSVSTGAHGETYSNVTTTVNR